MAYNEESPQETAKLFLIIIFFSQQYYLRNWLISALVDQLLAMLSGRFDIPLP